MVVTVVAIATALKVKMVAVVGTALERGTSLEKGTSLERGTSLLLHHKSIWRIRRLRATIFWA